MSGNVTRIAYKVIGLQADSPKEVAILRQRFNSVRKQFPWVYGIFIVNLVALNFAVPTGGNTVVNPTVAFLAVIAARLVHWVRLGRRNVADRHLRAELMTSCLVACGVCASYCAWILFLHANSAADHPVTIAIFGAMTAVGVFYGLSGFPAAARAPIYFLNIPLAVALVATGEPRQVSVGAALSFLTLLMLRMLVVQDFGFVRLVSTRFDIDRRRHNALQSEQSALQGQARFSEIANTDPLTGLHNRRGFMAAFDRETVSATPLGLVILDLDGFKPINDTFGHACGDALLARVGARLSAATKPSDCVARLGGDEFAILRGFTSAEAAEAFALNITGLLSEPFRIDGRQMAVSACAGASWRPVGQPITHLIREADIALYSAKKIGRGVVRGFCADMQDQIHRKTQIEQALRRPDLIETIDLAYQPIFNLETMELRAFEALARWEHSELGWISPAEFIPLTEQINTIGELSESLLRRAAGAARKWPSTVKLSFNLSPVQLCTVASAEKILETISEVGFPPDRLQVEVTETALMADLSVARANLATLRHAGVIIVLDDFGAGYASIGYLREINFDAIKLDGSLVSAITDVGSALPLLRGVLALCQALGRQCIAEHIETEAQLRILRQFGCRYGQGFGLGRPMPEAQARELVAPKIIEISEFRRAVQHGQA